VKQVVMMTEKSLPMHRSKAKQTLSIYSFACMHGMNTMRKYPVREEEACLPQHA